MLVCGSRTFTNWDIAWVVLNAHSPHCPTLIEGGARGADELGRKWAGYHGYAIETFPANWGVHGKAAGPIRNEQMLRSGIDICIAFVDKPLSSSRGTQDMVNRCVAAGIPVTLLSIHPVTEEDRR